MLELLPYVIFLELSPTGGAVSPRCKIALQIIIIEGGGEALVIDPEQFCTPLGLTHSRSLPRILKELAELQLITLEQGRGKDGKWVSSIAYPLPGVKRLANHNIAQDHRIVSGSNHNIVSGSVSNHNIVSGLSIEARRDLRDPNHKIVSGDSGTVLALKSPPPLNNNILNLRGKRGEVYSNEEANHENVSGLLYDPCVRVWQELTREDITPQTAEYISKRVKDVAVWTEVLEGWLASNWKATNVTGQIERYEKRIKELPQAPAKPKEKDPVEEERIRKLMYGE